MFTYLKENWATISSLGSVFVSFVIFLLATKFPKRDEFDSVVRDVSKLKKDVSSIQNKIDSLPTQQDIHKLNLEISGLRGDIKSIKPELEGVRHISDLLLENELQQGKNK